jgi:HEAT repeat protein
MYKVAPLLLSVCFLCDGLSAKSSEIQEDRVAEIICAIKSGDNKARGEAVARLKELGPKAEPAIPTLLQLLKDEDRKIRDDTAIALGRIGPAAVAHLCRALDDPDERVRAGAAYGLSFIQPPATTAVPILGNRLAKDKSDGVRINIISTLSGIDDKRAIPFLVQALESDPDKYVRSCAAWALGGFAKNTTDVAPPLIRALGMDPTEEGNGRIIYEAINSLSLLDFAVFPLLVEAIKNPNLRGCRYALDAVGGFLRNASEKKRVTGKSTVAGDIKIAIPVLTDCLKDADAETRLESIRAFEEMEEKAKPALPAIKRCLQDQSPFVRIAAAAAVFRISASADPGLPVLIEALKHVDLEIRLEAINQLTHYGSHAAPALSQLIDSFQDEDMRIPAIYAIEAIGPGAKDAIPVLQKLKRNGSVDEAKAASHALRKIKIEAP